METGQAAPPHPLNKTGLDSHSSNPVFSGRLVCMTLLNTWRFGELIVELRERRRLSQELLARTSEPSRQILSDIEQHKDIAISEATLAKLDQGFGLPRGFMHARLLTEHGPGADHWSGGRTFERDAAPAGPMTLGFHVISGEPLPLPAALRVKRSEFEALFAPLRASAKHILLDINAFGRNVATHDGGWFIKEWSRTFGEEHVGPPPQKTAAGRWG